MQQVLLLAMTASFWIKSWFEGGVIAAVMILNIIVGFFQEVNAELTMAMLRSLSSPTAVAIRDGMAQSVPTEVIVPGDLVELMTGDTVPADTRLVQNYFDTMLQGLVAYFHVLSLQVAFIIPQPHPLEAVYLQHIYCSALIDSMLHLILSTVCGYEY